jgi:hypothetical protein
VTTARFVASLAALLLLLPSCLAPRPLPVTPAEEEVRLPEFREGTTTREEVLLRLGAPTGRFEGDRILTFMLGVTEDGALLPVVGDVSWRDPRFRQWDVARYSLVTVFEGGGRLVRHSLVRVN